MPVGSFMSSHEASLAFDSCLHLSACQTALRIRADAHLGQRQLHLSRDALASVQVLVAARLLRC